MQCFVNKIYLTPTLDLITMQAYTDKNLTGYCLQEIILNPSYAG